MGKWTKQAKVALSQGDYNQAGDFFKMDGDYRAAIKAYTNGGNVNEAAKLYESLGKTDKAEKLLLKSGSPQERAHFYIRNHNAEKAVDIYVAHNLHFDAAKLLEKMGRLGKAAALYEAVDFHEQAGVLYGKSKNFDKAIEMFQKVIAKLDKTDSRVKAKVHKYQLWIANLYIGARNFLKAGELFEELHQLEKAAKSYVKGNEPLRAASIFIKLGATDEALSMLQGLDSLESRILQGKVHAMRGDHERVIQLLADTGEYKLLADAYQELGRFQEGAFLQEKLGNLKEAANLYEKAQDHRRAAILYEQNGYYSEAAACYEAQEKWGHAAKLYHLGKKRFKAGYCLYKFQRFEDALKWLQLIEDDDPDYIQARYIMAEIFFRQRVFSVARQIYEELLGESLLSNDNMNAFYYMARCQEEDGAIDDARRIYERILAKKFNFADVSDRLRALKNVHPQANLGLNLGVSATPPPERKIHTPSDLTIGDVIDGRFKILDTIGKGGMGAIFKVKDLELSRNIALKMLTHKSGDFEELKVELLIARDLTHPYIIKVFDVGSWMGMGYFTMEAVNGKPLKTYILNSKEDNQDKKVRLLIKICEGLKAAHDQNVVHRDIKPQNIMIDKDFNPKVLDFGIARKTTTDTSGKPISGSPKYMAPEQIKNTLTDVRTDIYAMGIIMYYMFTLKEPFLAKTPQAVMRMHLDTPLPNPMERNPEIPYWLSEIIIKCCMKEPAMRFADMGELIDELKLNLMDF